MNYQHFASDLPLGRTDIFTSPEELEERVRGLGVNHHVRQLGRGQFRGDITMLRTEQADFAADRYSTASAFRLESPPDTACLLFPRSAGEPIRALGTEVTRRNLVLLPAASGIDLWAPSLAGSEGVVISQERFVELIGVLWPDVQPPEVAVVVEGDPVSLDTIRGEVLEILAHPECEPDQGFVSNVFATVFDWLAERLGYGESDRLPDARSCRRVAERTQAYIETHYRQSICLQDLCLAAEVSARTLQRCFRHCFDLSVTEYLKAVRFDAARRALAATHSEEQSVAQIALDHGFTHLGRFSVEFKQRFGIPAYSLLVERRPPPQHKPALGDAEVSQT